MQIGADLFGGVASLHIDVSIPNEIRVRVKDEAELNGNVRPFELVAINEEFAMSTNFSYAYVNSFSRNELYLESLQKIDFLAKHASSYTDVASKRIHLSAPLFVPAAQGTREYDLHLRTSGKRLGQDSGALCQLCDVRLAL